MLSDNEKKARRIGGSTIAKIVKQSAWGTPMDAYLDLGGRHEEKTGEDIDRGNFLEPSLLSWANKKIGETFVKSKQVVFPEWDWATVNPDGLSEKKSIIEIKAPRRDDLGNWGEDGTDHVPADALLQTHWGMMVTDSERGFVAALLGGDLRVYKIQRDRELEAKLLAAAKAFINIYVIPGVPPPPEWGDDQNILSLHPKNIRPHRQWTELSEQERYVVGEYLSKYQFESEALTALEGWEPVIKNVIGDADGINLSPELGKRIDWKANATAGTKWKQLAEHLLENFAPADVEALKAKFAGTPTRALKPYFNKEKKNG